MERYNSVPIEKTDNKNICRITLHKDLKEALRRSIIRSQKITLSPMGSIVVLRAANVMNIRKRSDRFVERIDGEGNIPLTKELMDMMYWNIHDRIAVYYVEDDLLILKMGKRYFGGGFASMNVPESG